MADYKEVPQYANVINGKIDILKQYMREKESAIKVRQTKIQNWIKNEESYNGVVQKTLLTRSNLHNPIVFEGVQNMAAKLGAAPDVKFDTIPEGDENAADIMEHVLKQDLADTDWDSLYDNSKVESGIYGRAIYKVIPGNDKNRIELVDTLAFLISPIARNTKDALYQGQQFIYKTMDQLEKEADAMDYDMEELNKLKVGKVASDFEVDSTSETSAKNLRMAQMGLANTTQYGSKVYDLTEWWTYLKLDKNQKVTKKAKAELYSVTVANDMYVLRVKKASELGLKRPPFISWGTYTRGITFWCPAIADIYRDPNLAIDVSLNQAIDNNTYRNFGMLFVSSSSGLKQSSIVPRPLGVTTVQTSPEEKIQDKIWQMPVPEIGDPVNMTNIIKGFADSAAGMSPGAMPKGKVSVTQQAQLNSQVEAKVVVMKRNATLACQELYQLMSDITKDRMTKPRKVKIFGYKNLTLEDVTKDNFDGVELEAKATPSEDSQQNKQLKQKAKMDLYEVFKDDPKVPGQLAMRRSLAKSFDIPADELESWFTEDKQDPAQQAAPLQPQTTQPPATGQQEPAPTQASPLLGATQQAAQMQVPPGTK
jgi:hypothetical protein